MNTMIIKILRHPATVPVVVGAISFGGGLALGLAMGRRQGWGEANEKLNEEVSDELAERRESRRLIIDENHPALQEAPKPPPEVTVEEHIRRKLEGGPQPIEDDAPPIVASNVFAENIGDIDNWDYEVEKRNRTSDAPYILHRDEFFAREMPGFAQKTFTYWAGDNTLSNDETPPQPIYNMDQVVGDCLRWGHGSGESHVVYIRNEMRSEEYEVTLDEGSYELEVKGFDIEQDHMQHAVPRHKFRPEE